MSVPVSPLIHGVEAPPIAEAMSWVRPGQRNRDLLNLCQAVPSYPPAVALQGEFARLAGQSHISGYTEILGIEALREAHARHVARDYDCDIDPRQVAMTSGCNQAFAVALMGLAKAGDEIILPSPWYFNHQMWLTMLGIGIKAIPAFTENASHPSPADAAAQINSRTRAIVLCSPNNPTGAIYPPSVLQAFYELAKECSVALIIDETYKDFRPGKEPAHGLFKNKNWDETLIQLYSFSKVYALPGYRLGAMLTSSSFLAEAEKIIDCMTICPAHITQEGAVFALRELESWKEGKLSVMAGRLAAMRAAFKRPGLRFELASSGAYFAYVRHPFRGQTAKSVAIKLAQENDVLCLPGSMFGPGQEDYLRFAFANVDADLMDPLIDRLIESQA